MHKLAMVVDGNMTSASFMLNHGDVSAESETCCVLELDEAKSPLFNMPSLLEKLQPL